MNFKDRFKELGYELKEKYFGNMDYIVNGSFLLSIDYDKKKIVVFESDVDSLCEISKELLKILWEYLQEKRFFEDE